MKYIVIAITVLALTGCATTSKEELRQELMEIDNSQPQENIRDWSPEAKAKWEETYERYL